MERPILNGRPIEYQLEINFSFKITFKNLMWMGNLLNNASNPVRTTQAQAIPAPTFSAKNNGYTKYPIAE